MTASTLLLILCISFKFTTTSCSKVPQGLRFPLGVSGLCTGQYFQRAPTRDSDNLVKPFMQVAIQTTRYYATLSKLLLYNLNIIKAVNNFLLTLHVSMQIGLYHHNCNLSYVWRIVSEDLKVSKTSLSLYFLYLPLLFITNTFFTSFLKS